MSSIPSLPAIPTTITVLPKHQEPSSISPPKSSVVALPPLPGKPDQQTTTNANPKDTQSSSWWKSMFSRKKAVPKNHGVSQKRTQSLSETVVPVHLHFAIVYHPASSAKAAHEIESLLKLDTRNIVHKLTPSAPKNLPHRAALISNCDLIIVIATRTFQRTPQCLELIHFAKDRRKPMLAVLHPVTINDLREFEEEYKPYGALGAILASFAGNWVSLEDQESFGTLIQKRIEVLVPTRKLAIDQMVAGLEGVRDIDEVLKNNAKEGIESFEKGTASGTKFLVVHANDVPQCLRAIEKALESKDVQYVSYAESSVCHFEKIQDCNVVVLIMSSGMDSLQNARLDMEYTKACNKALIPVMGMKGYWPICDWMALAIAGKKFFEIYDDKQGNSPYDANLGPPDSTPCKDFVVESDGAHKFSLVLNEDREEKQIRLLKAQLRELKAQLGPSWEPDVDAVFEKPEVTLPPKPTIENGLKMANINYSITRLTLTAAPPLFDENGNPTDKKFDFMMSYNWGIQGDVRKLYEQLNMKNFNGWLDIWGNMQGNMNEAMAAGIERSYSILVFLTSKYQSSPNCQLELGYALYLKKPIIIVYSEKNLTTTNLSQQAIDCATASFDLSELFLPRGNEQVDDIDMLSWHLRVNIMKSNEIQELDQSVTVRKLLKAIEIGKRELLGAKSKTCARCGKFYDDSKKSGCTVHTAYFVGGTILAGRWVCCSQAQKEAVGCSPAEHTDRVQVWTVDPDYGTSTWTSG
ncbi:hypothetical protein BDR26DRAFT_1007362 [Obelidium mucronatum]|nr:hypothetical protein BDR26DRAFT_1007362 [Obelidium mucronatum]